MWRKFRPRLIHRHAKPLVAPPPALTAPPSPPPPPETTPLTRSPSLPQPPLPPSTAPLRSRTDIGTENDTVVQPEIRERQRNPRADLINRRLSLDGNLPDEAIRPDDTTYMDGGEGVVNVTGTVDVSGCSKAGWEPMKDAYDAPPMHTVEVRKENQDAFCAHAPFCAPESDQIFLGVFDGHGAEGRPIAHYARDYITTMAKEASSSLSWANHRERLDTLKAAFSRAERALAETQVAIDHVFSGTTAVVAWLFGRHVYTAWTGDSRCVIGRMVSPENGRSRFKAVDLSHDQKPVRPDERRRVRSAGGRIARWQRNMGPLRVWLPKDWTPGLAMTRSIGDTVLSEYGVSPIPEVTYTQLGPGDSFMVLASDGVWEFMTSQEVVDFVGRMRREGRSAHEAAEALVREAVRRWRRNEVVVDDTTAVVMWMKWEEADKTAVVSRPRRVFSIRAKAVLKSNSMGVHLIGDDGHLSDFVSKNDVLQGV